MRGGHQTLASGMRTHLLCNDKTRANRCTRAHGQHEPDPFVLAERRHRPSSSSLRPPLHFSLHMWPAAHAAPRRTMADETAGAPRPARITQGRLRLLRQTNAIRSVHGPLAISTTRALRPVSAGGLRGPSCGTRSRRGSARYVRGTNGLNVDAFDAHAAPILHRAAPLAPLLREQPEARGAAWDLLVTEHEIHEKDWQDFFPALAAPPNEDAPTWDTVLEGSSLERVCGDVCAMLDEFDEPPFTMQRLAELLIEPQAHYHTRSKYLAALSRVLAVSPVPHAPSGPDTPDSPAFRVRASSETTPMYAPIPFLATPTVHASGAGGAGAAPVSEGLGVPSGPIDELDSTEARGAVTDVVQPLSAATHVDVPDKRARTQV